MLQLTKLSSNASVLQRVLASSVKHVRGYRDSSVQSPERSDDALEVLKYSVSGKDPMDFLPKQSDVLIIGGGIMGCSVAYWLKQMAKNALSVTVLERDFTYKQSSTVLSVGGIRQQFSEPENVQMSLFGAEFLRNLQSHLKLSASEEVPDVQYNPQGYLFLSSEKGAEQLERNYSMQVQLGSKVQLMKPAELAAKWPWMNVSDVALGCFGTENEGWFDGWLLLSAFRKKCLEQGVRFIYGELLSLESKSQLSQRVESDSQGPKSVTLDAAAFLHPESAVFRSKDGKTHLMDAAVFVNAAGPFAGQVARMAGIGTSAREVLSVGLPVEPRKRYVYSIHCPTFDGAATPLVVDMSGAYFKRENFVGVNSVPYFVTGLSPEKDEEPDTKDLEVDHSFFEEKIWPILAHRAPCFETARVKSAWAGYYDYNVIDQNLIVGPHPLVRNMYFANGSSGHGIQHAPAIGRAVAELIVHREYRTIDLTRFQFDRFLRREPIFEKNVV